MNEDTIESLRERVREATRNRCDHCGAKTIDNCPRCGAPQCCPQCCQIDALRESLLETEKERDQLRERAIFWRDQSEARESYLQRTEASLREQEERNEELAKLLQDARDYLRCGRGYMHLVEKIDALNLHPPQTEP